MRMTLTEKSYTADAELLDWVALAEVRLFYFRGFLTLRRYPGGRKGAFVRTGSHQRVGAKLRFDRTEDPDELIELKEDGRRRRRLR